MDIFYVDFSNLLLPILSIGAKQYPTPFVIMTTNQVCPMHLLICIKILNLLIFGIRETRITKYGTKFSMLCSWIFFPKSILCLRHRNRQNRMQNGSNLQLEACTRGIIYLHLSLGPHITGFGHFFGKSYIKNTMPPHLHLLGFLLRSTCMHKSHLRNFNDFILLFYSGVTKDTLVEF